MLTPAHYANVSGARALFLGACALGVVIAALVWRVRPKEDSPTLVDRMRAADGDDARWAQ